MLLGSAVRRDLFDKSHSRPFYGDDESKVLRDANYSNCPMGADGEHRATPGADADATLADWLADQA
jgi:hypothetical protein